MGRGQQNLSGLQSFGGYAYRNLPRLGIDEGDESEHHGIDHTDKEADCHQKSK